MDAIDSVSLLKDAATIALKDKVRHCGRTV
jgi:hypothetical protein